MAEEGRDKSRQRATRREGVELSCLSDTGVVGVLWSSETFGVVDIVDDIGDVIIVEYVIDC